MKKQLILLLALLAMVPGGCKKEGGEPPVEPLPGKDKGTLSITYTVTDAEGEPIYYGKVMQLNLTGAEEKNIYFPADGVVKDLTPGEYTVEVKSTGGRPIYSGSATATVRAGEITDVEVVCELRSSEIVFDHEMKKLLSAPFITWDPTKNDPVEFHLRMRSDDRLHEMWIRGFTTAPTGDEFVLAEGTYKIGAMPGEEGFGEAMTVVPGHIQNESAFVPTMGFDMTWERDDPGQQPWLFNAGNYFAETGEMRVFKTGTSAYAIELEFSGRALTWKSMGGAMGTWEESEASRAYYLETPDLIWENRFTVPGTLVYEDVPAGNYTASGVVKATAHPEIVGPGSWQGALARSTDPETGDPDNYGWTISHWGNTQGKMFLKYDNGRLFADDNRGFTIENGAFIVTMMGGYINEFNELVFVPRPEGKFNPDTGVIDFARKHPLGSDLGVCAAQQFLAAPGIYYLTSDLYINAKIDLGGGSRAPQMSAEKVVKIPSAMKNIPVRVERRSEGYPFRVERGNR
jgi:hypothetical protein